MKKITKHLFVCLLLILDLSLLHQILESHQTPILKKTAFLMRFDSFYMVLPDEYLVYAPASGTLQIAALGNVLSYGSNWQVAKVKPYLYHLREDGVSPGFYFMVNTSSRQFYQVTQGTFGHLGGNQTLFPDVSVEVVGGAGDTTPDRFFIRHSGGQLHWGGLGYDAAAKKVILGFMGDDVTVPGDWQFCGCGANVFHFKHKNWAGFYWRANILTKTAWRVNNGVLCQPGGTEMPLNVQWIINQ